MLVYVFFGLIQDQHGKFKNYILPFKIKKITFFALHLTVATDTCNLSLCFSDGYRLSILEQKGN